MARWCGWNFVFTVCLADALEDVRARCLRAPAPAPAATAGTATPATRESARSARAFRIEENLKTLDEVAGRGAHPSARTAYTLILRDCNSLRMRLSGDPGK